MDLVTFDLDETLITAKKCHWKAFNDAFEENGLKKITYSKLIPLLNGQHAHRVVKILFPKLTYKKIHKLVNLHHKYIGTRYGKYAKKIRGVVQAIKKIKKKHKIGIVTNCSHQEVNGLLKGAKIDKRIFNIIIAKDDVRKSKPAPNELFKAEKLCKCNILFHVGDSPYDVIAGRRSKTKVIAVLTGVNSRKLLKKEKPYKIVKSIKDVPKVILSE